jgi:predicted small lipoprotein YifL
MRSRFFLLCALVVMAAGCGQMGPLYLPKPTPSDSQPNGQQSSATETTERASDEASKNKSKDTTAPSTETR